MESNEPTSKTDTDSERRMIAQGGGRRGGGGSSRKVKGLMGMDNSVVIAGGREVEGGKWY